MVSSNPVLVYGFNHKGIVNLLNNDFMEDSIVAKIEINQDEKALV